MKKFIILLAFLSVIISSCTGYQSVTYSTRSYYPSIYYRPVTLYTYVQPLIYRPYIYPVYRPYYNYPTPPRQYSGGRRR